MKKGGGEAQVSVVDLNSTNWSLGSLWVNLEFLSGKMERVRFYKSGRPLCRSQPSLATLRNKSFPLPFHVYEMDTVLCDLELCLFVLNLINYFFFF